MAKVKMINLTPHPISFMRVDGSLICKVEPSGSLARVSVAKTIIGEINGIPIKQSTYGAIEGLPDPEDGVIYLVSSIVAQRCPERPDVLIPDDSIRDEQGRIIGCMSLGDI